MAYDGWHQVAYERELTQPLSTVSIGSTELLMLKRPEGVRAFETHCPHRGANLAYGGRHEQDSIVCPFHGRRIGLDAPGEDGYCVRGFRTVTAGGLVFVLLDDALDTGFGTYIEALERTHFIVPGFTISVRTKPEYVIENALDRRHFSEVHGVTNTPELQLLPSERGEMTVRARLLTPRPNPWQEEASSGVDLVLRIFSPTLCATEIIDARTSIVLTAATPDPSGQCRIRVSLAVPPRPDGTPPAEGPLRALLRDSRTAIEQDAKIWEHLPPNAPNRFAPDDDLIVDYYRFCTRFRHSDRASRNVPIA